jgi:Astacin (Peptidase family M12A)
MNDVLEAGEVLPADKPMYAQNQSCRLTFQSDGNLVLSCSRPGGWIPRWSTGTWDRPVDQCVMQEDGNLVLYNAGSPVWSSDTWTFPGARLVVQDDENVVIYHQDHPVWASNTSLDGTPVKGDGPKVYFVLGGVRHWIPDEETLTAQYGGWGAVSVLTETRLDQWPEGDPMPSVITPSALHLCHDRAASGAPLPPRRTPVVPPRIRPDGSVILSTQQPLVGETAKMWDVGQTLRVKMMGGTPVVRGKVRQYAEEWTKYANIRFEFVDPSQAAEIKVAFDPGGSWSTVGRDALWVPFDFATMNFGWLTDSTPEAEFSRVILHEFGHALGLVHEHQSPVAGIAWDREKIYAHYQQSDGWDRGMVDAQVFARYSVSSTNYSQFDPNSIMEYWIPASVTLDGREVPGGSTLSATDKEFIRRWYPAPPKPGAATGLLRTGDDCDEIDFRVEYGVEEMDQVGFTLSPASGLDWWKAIEVPIGGGGYRMFQMQDNNSDGGTIPRAELDSSRPIRFWKAKAFGVHTRLGYTWDVLTALPGGSRLSLNWKRDRC